MSRTIPIAPSSAQSVLAMLPTMSCLREMIAGRQRARTSGRIVEVSNQMLSTRVVSARAWSRVTSGFSLATPRRRNDVVGAARSILRGSTISNSFSLSKRKSGGITPMTW
jgi:hypothetical protein